jgi:hypothetical protein
MDTDKPNWGCLLFWVSLGTLFWNYPKTMIGLVLGFILLATCVSASGDADAARLNSSVRITATAIPVGNPDGPDIDLMVDNRSSEDINAYYIKCGNTTFDSNAKIPAGTSLTERFDSNHYDTGSTSDYLPKLGPCRLTFVVT